MSDALTFVVLVAFAAVGHALLPHILRYRLTDEAVEMVLCGVLTVFYLPYDEIESVRAATAAEVVINKKAINRLWGPFIVAFRKGRLKRPVVLSPADAEDFLRDIRERSLRA